MNEFTASRTNRPVGEAMWRGSRSRCPACGEGALFASFVTTADHCEACGTEFHHHRADDLPAYLVVLILGHIVVGGFMSFQMLFDLSTWQHLAIWVPITVVGAVALLRPVKGAVVGLQWALYMHGFGGDDDTIETHPELEPGK